MPFEIDCRCVTVKPALMQGLASPPHLLPLLLCLFTSQPLPTNLKFGCILVYGLGLRLEFLQEDAFPYQVIAGNRIPLPTDKF